MMTARGFILGILTRHLPTKVLSLLLSIVLFLFVAARQTEDMQIRELVVQLRLGESLREGWILRSEDLNLGGMITIRGQRSEVETVRVRISSHTLVRELGSEDLAALIGDGPTLISYSFEVDADLLYRLKILPPETIQVREIDRSRKNPTIEIVKRKKLTMPISVSNETALALSTNSAWVSPGGESKVTASFEPAQVEIAGPADIMSTWKTSTSLPVHIRDVNTILDERGATPGRIVRDDIRGVDWAKLGVGEKQTGFFRLLTPKEGPVGLLKDEVELVFEIRPKEEQYPLPPLPVNLRLLSDAGFKLEDKYTIRPRYLVYTTDKIKELKVLGPKSVLRDEDFMKRLVAVVNVAYAVPDGGRLIALVELDLSGVKDSADRDKLHQLKLLPTDGEFPALLLEEK